MADRRLVLLPILLLLLLLPGPRAIADGGADYDLRLDRLVAHPAVSAALTAIARLETTNIDRLIELTEIAAPPFQEQARARRFAQLLDAAGVGSVEIDAEGNVLALRRGDGRAYTVAVVAHLDTVFPAGTDVRVRRADQQIVQVGGEIQDAKLYAPGIGDNARGLVLLLSLVDALTEAEVSTESNILFVGSVGEEGIGDLRGIKHLLRDGGPRIDELIAIDGGNDQRVLNQAIGSHRYRIAVKGPGGHSWGAFGMANPAHALASAIHQFDEAARAFVRQGPRSTYNIGKVGGGTSVNAVPFESWAEVDLRSENSERLLALVALLQQTFHNAVDTHNRLRDRGAALTLEFTTIGQRPSGLVDPDTPLVQRAMASARHYGLSPVLGSGSTDANVAIAQGIPATTISRGGRGGGAHSLQEWWSSENVELGSKKALLLLLASAGVLPATETAAQTELRGL
jgi:acetylornithine deacetylase/succinyl-diaminopimelate desuccinylase-like protein